jgi:hypothetical protein
MLVTHSSNQVAPRQTRPSLEDERIARLLRGARRYRIPPRSQPLRLAVVPARHRAFRLEHPHLGDSELGQPLDDGVGLRALGDALVDDDGRTRSTPLLDL